MKRPVLQSDPSILPHKTLIILNVRLILTAMNVDILRFVFCICSDNHHAEQHQPGIRKRPQLG